MNSRTQSAIQSVFEGNPSNEVLRQGALNGTGTTIDKPRFLQGRVLGAMQIGMAVVMAGMVPAEAGEFGGDSISFAPAAPGGICDGIADRVEGNYVRVRRLEGDMEFAGIVVGVDYVVGTDSRPAKAGDSNYPSAVASPVALGVGWVNNRIMLGATSRHAAAATISTRFGGDSDPIAAAVATRVKKATVNVDLLFDPRLLRVGDEIEFKAICDIGAGSANPRLHVKVGAAYLWQFNGPAPNVVGDEFICEGRLVVRETGSSGKVLTHGHCYTWANGFIAAAAFSVGTPLALDLSQASLNAEMFGLFSAAGANSLIVKDASFRLRS